MYYIDTHIHLQDYNHKDVNNVVTKAQKNNVMLFINPSSHPDDWPRVSAISAQFTRVISAYGIHPWYIDNIAVDWEIKLAEQLAKNPHAWVGECGIDTIKQSNNEAQCAVFTKHIDIAKAYHRPLIIHSVKANQYLSSFFSQLPQQTIFHSFTGSLEWGKEIQKHGFYLGLNFSIMRKNQAENIIKNIDLNRVLLETDGPYQPLNKGDISLPENLPQLAQFIADIRQISLAEMQDILYQNWLNFTGER